MLLSLLSVVEGLLAFFVPELVDVADAVESPSFTDCVSPRCSISSTAVAESVSSIVDRLSGVSTAAVGVDSPPAPAFSLMRSA